MNARKVFTNILAVVGGIAIVGGAIYYFGNRVASGILALAPRIKNLRIDWQNATLTGVLEIPIDNKNNFSIPTAAFDGAIMYRNYYNLADIRILEPVTLASEAVTVLRANFIVNFADLSANLVKIIQDQAFYPSLYLKGVLQAGKFKLKINQNIQVI